MRTTVYKQELATNLKSVIVKLWYSHHFAGTRKHLLKKSQFCGFEWKRQYKCPALAFSHLDVSALKDLKNYLPCTHWMIFRQKKIKAEEVICLWRQFCCEVLKMDLRLMFLLALFKTQDAVTISAEHHYSRYFHLTTLNSTNCEDFQGWWEILWCKATFM